MEFNVYTPHPRAGGPHLSYFHMGNSILVVKGRILDYVSTPTSNTAWPCHETSATSHIGFLANLKQLLPDGFSIEDTTRALHTITARAPWSPPPHDLVDASEMFSFHLWAYLRHRSRELLEWTKGSPTVKEMLGDYNRIIKRVEALALDIDYSLLQSIEDVTEEEWMAVKTSVTVCLGAGTSPRPYWRKTHVQCFGYCSGWRRHRSPTRGRSAICYPPLWRRYL
ncbi:unnamed protein product [Aspergillus oryzae]|uniref:Unnamed protein product n=2 Tax=Aspergillus oryzae TaxID=5062 RepID=A0AAN4YJY9_ASPOZ|nr:unnamed protein product [Aspergillus oryzae]GMF96815.1 unnamed protein product [Aspergillus oryzae]GMG13184.1 unnamed protein product [Aspergillus oryzae]GMG30451.1 unnamed protein product [Aspergillus oryzae]GMG52825.1 unnamed protein product [Aspergillus oryzae var. brunneus]